MSNSAQEQSGPSDELQGEDIYQVEEILKKNVLGTRYLIKWIGYPDPKDYTWQPLAHLKHVMHMVREFDQRHVANSKKIIKKDEEHRVKKKRQIKEKNEKESSSDQEKQSKIDEQKQSQKQKESQKQKQSQKEPQPQKQKQKQPEKKEKVSKGGYFPKIITKGIYPERPPNYEKKSYFSYQSSYKQKEKEQLNKYMAPVATKAIKANEQSDSEVQPKQSEKKSWYNQQPYRLAFIFRHFVEKGEITYLCDVEYKGDLACSILVGSEQVGKIDSEMEKRYILRVMWHLAKQKARRDTLQYQQFERSWKTSK